MSDTFYPLAGIADANAPQTTLMGTTSGSIVWSQPIQGSAIKEFVAYAYAYKNSTGTAQTITFTTSFVNIPAIVQNDTGMALTVNMTTLTFPTSMSATASGNILIVGF